eukprot:1158671-Pelagomonas_calceolata.AAC.6
MAATASEDFTCRVWDLDEEVCAHVLEGHSGWCVLCWCSGRGVLSVSMLRMGPIRGGLCTRAGEAQRLWCVLCWCCGRSAHMVCFVLFVPPKNNNVIIYG